MAPMVAIESLVEILEDVQREVAIRSVNSPTATLSEVSHALRTLPYSGKLLMEYSNGHLVEVCVPIYLRIRVR